MAPTCKQLIRLYVSVAVGIFHAEKDPFPGEFAHQHMLWVVYMPPRGSVDMDGESSEESVWLIRPIDKNTLGITSAPLSCKLTSG